MSSSTVILNSNNEGDLLEELEAREVEIGVALGRAALRAIERCEREAVFAVYNGSSISVPYESYTNALERGLGAAIEAEEYELAAEIRDMLEMI
jgi:hypothetical protein